MHRILVSDQIATEGLAILRQQLDVDVRTGLSENDLVACIGEYDGLVVRSQTQVTRPVIENAHRLKVVGRAGVGVDNIDIDAATEKGILVVNSPAGNTTAVAEFTIGLMLALLRHIPQSHVLLKSGQWSRSRFIGTQLHGKRLGIIGLGRIGTEVARRAKALGMEVLGYDPFISFQRAQSLGVELADIDDTFARSDCISLHCPLTKETRNLVNAASIATMKDGVYLINTARGGVIDEAALVAALRSGKIAGAALDVFQEEPPKDNPLVTLENVIVTPHLAASTRESQVDVAVDVAEQIVDVFRGRIPVSAVNMPAVPPEQLEALRPYLKLAEKLGRMHSQLATGRIESVEITCAGHVAEQDTSPLTRSFLKGLMETVMPFSINLINAPRVAEARGIDVIERRSASVGDYVSLITVGLRTSSGTRQLAGTVFGKNDPRIIGIDGYRVDVVPHGLAMISEHIDRPGVIGHVATVLGEANINIAGMHVGRQEIGGRAVMVLNVDSPIPEELLLRITRFDNIQTARLVDFGN